MRLKPLLICLAGLTAFGANAQSPFAGNVSYASSASHGLVPAPPATTADNAVATAFFVGKVVNPAGAALPGSVVKLLGTDQLAVANGEGEFLLTVPATDAPLQLLVSYAGFESETTTLSFRDQGATLMLATPIAIKVARKQQLKTYRKTARHQMKRSLRHL